MSDTLFTLIAPGTTGALDSERFTSTLSDLARHASTGTYRAIRHEPQGDRPGWVTVGWNEATFTIVRPFQAESLDGLVIA